MEESTLSCSVSFPWRCLLSRFPKVRPLSSHKDMGPPHRHTRHKRGRLVLQRRDCDSLFIPESPASPTSPNQQPKPRKRRTNAPRMTSSQQQHHHRAARSRRSSSSQRSRSQSPTPLSTLASEFPKPVIPRRAVSYPDGSLALRHRIRIQYRDEGLRLRSLENVTQLIQSVATIELRCDLEIAPLPLTNSEILARKALKYRNVLGRMHDVDVHDPTFDASEFLGVQWCKCAPKSIAPRSA